MENNVKFNAKQFGDNLKQARIEKGLTAEYVCKYVGISLTSLSTYENNKALPRIDIVVKMADCLSISVDILIKDCLIKE